MVVLLACFGPALAAGVTAWWVARRWTSDRGASRLSPATGSPLLMIGTVAAAGAAVFGGILEMVRSDQGFAAFDGSVARFGATHATSTSTQVLRLITQIGGAVVLVPLAVVVGLLEIRRIRSWTTAWFLTVVIGGQFLLANAIKAAVDRARPDLLRLTGFSGPSFPSGHATASSAAFAAFALLAGRKRSPRVKQILAAVAFAGGVLVSATRVLLGVHWLTDVLAGVALGWTWFVVTSIAFGGRRLRVGAPIATAKALTPPAPA